MPTVFVIGENWTLRGAVRAELLEQGVEALGFNSVDDAAHAAAAGPAPDVIVLDMLTANASDPALEPLARRASLLAVVSGAGTPQQLPPGTAVMRRPVRVAEIVSRVRQMLEGQAA